MNAVIEIINVLAQKIVEPEFLINLTLKTSLILAFTGLLNVLLQGASASVRHWFWSLAFVGVLLFPLLSSTLPVWQLEVLPTFLNSKSEEKAIASLEPSAITLNANRQASLNLKMESTNTLPQYSTFSNTPIQSEKAEPLGKWYTNIDWPVWVLLIWIAGSLFVLTRTLFEILWFTVLARKGDAARNGDWRTSLEQLKTRLSIKRPIYVSFSKYSPIPLTFGLFRPVILLPQAARNWSAHQRETVLLHELAHVKRLDYATNILAYLACALYWYNPLAWIAARQLHIEREYASDDFVLRQGAENIDYANQLLAIARPLTQKADLGYRVIAMANHSHIKKRMQHILSQKIRRHSLTRLSAVVSVIAVAAIIIPLAVMHLQAKQNPSPDTPLQELISKLQSHETEIQKHAAWALGEREDRDAVPSLIETLKDEDSEVRAMAAWALGEIKDRSSLDSLLSALNEQNVYAREMVTRAIGELEDPRAVQPLLDLLSDPELDVQSAALWSLGEIGDRSSFYTVIKILNDPHDKIRIATLSALRGIGCDPAFVAVTLSLRDASPAVRYAAAKILGEFTHKPTNTPVQKVLVDYNSSFPPILQEVFGEFENLTAIEYLIRTLADSQAGVRAAAAETLGKIGHPNAVGALMGSLQDTEPDVRAMAVWALDEINI